MPLEFDTTDELLTFVSESGVSCVHAQGYEWFWGVLTPALQSSKTRSQEDKERLADCHYVAGDVHDFNNAPLAAIEEYKKALSYDPEHASSYREIANMQEKYGDLKSASVNIERALDLNPEDKFTLTDHEWIHESLKDKNYSPLYEKGDACWAAFEHLANAEPARALGLLEKPKNLQEARVRMCALGALEQHDAYMASWREILRETSEISFEYHDWFFISDAVHEAPEIWKLFLDSEAQFGGVFATFEKLEESDAYRLLSTDEKIRLRMEYYLYYQSKDFSGLERLYKAYPEWAEVSESLNS